MESPGMTVARSWRSGTFREVPYMQINEQNTELPWESRVRAEGIGGYVSEPPLRFSVPPPVPALMLVTGASTDRVSRPPTLEEALTCRGGSGGG